MTLNFHKKPQRNFVFHFFFNFYSEAMWKTDYQSQSPCRHAKTVLESFFVLCVYRPHDIGIGVASDQIRKSLLCTVSASSCYRKYYERTNRDIVWDIPDWPDMYITSFYKGPRGILPATAIFNLWFFICSISCQNSCIIAPIWGSICSLEMPVPSQGHYGFHSFTVVDWFCLFIYLWVLTFPL
jgi:hypothetical protein